ncbi:uncharacterized protein IL334_006493 [Kwoniella shivajii]|uniref:F-box domain-containing protein n=1 Tax=Kwoniella shivajii TaxID=564305 RepID=A0ABZ1DA14_9TREE|nr:hypothetical protein IL334_006493 [Kwoniella shivajii]
MSIQTQPKFNRSTLPIPFDLLYVLIQELLSTCSLSTLSKLSSLSKEYYALITPLLYTDVHITSDEQLQAFLTLPQEKDRRMILAGALLGVKRGRSGSIKGPNRKLEALSLTRSLKLDVYPSRTSLKLSSKLPSPLKASNLTFTSKALINLHGRLSNSKAPRILASFWAGHLPNLIRPKKVIIDYSSILPKKSHPPIGDVEPDDQEEQEAQGDDEGESSMSFMSDEKWTNTMGGMSIALQSWIGLQEVELKGNTWSGILPGPGVNVKMVHAGIENEVIENETQNEVDGEGQGLMTVNETILNGNGGEPNAEIIKAIETRNKLIENRKKALILGLRTSQAIYENYHSPLPINWKVENLLPSLIGTHDNEEEIESERQREKRSVIEDIMRDLDETCPSIMTRYGYINDVGRRDLSCLTWNRDE